jgi:hypothetical protein
VHRFDHAFLGGSDHPCQGRFGRDLRYPREPFGWQLDAVRPEFIREGGSDERDLS